VKREKEEFTTETQRLDFLLQKIAKEAKADDLESSTLHEEMLVICLGWFC
jgi:hypothetical protein